MANNTTLRKEFKKALYNFIYEVVFFESMVSNNAMTNAFETFCDNIGAGDPFIYDELFDHEYVLNELGLNFDDNPDKVNELLQDLYDIIRDISSEACADSDVVLKVVVPSSANDKKLDKILDKYTPSKK